MEKSTKIGIGIFVVIVAVGFLFLIGGDGSVTGNTISIDSQGNDGFSGNVIGIDPNRAMAGSPCHFMGGGAMGDCQTREVDIEAQRWSWSEPIITVKSGELVRIKATSKDVSHGIAIPEIRFNLRIDPGRTSVGEFIAPAPGEYTYGCSVMCGSGHGNHKGKLVVV